LKVHVKTMDFLKDSQQVHMKDDVILDMYSVLLVWGNMRVSRMVHVMDS